MKRLFQRDPLFRSYVHALGFTLAKVEFEVWKLYVEEFASESDEVKQMGQSLFEELRSAHAMVRCLSESRDPLWFRPWLSKSVELRAPMIHPLNLLQILAIQDRDFSLLRVTVTGIASGMMTTG
jgi:phosphoenolpyruvate carboxylase